MEIDWSECFHGDGCTTLRRPRDAFHNRYAPAEGGGWAGGGGGD